MIIPIRTDRHQQRTPWVNYGLILANVLVFILFQRAGSQDQTVRAFLLDPEAPRVYQFFSCMFMHAGFAHLIGNMIFLWVFGHAVNDAFGHAAYLLFYLAGGVIAGIGYVLLSGTAPVLGASGAIAAVTGAFLVLFPRVRVTLLVLMLYVLVPWEVSSLFFLLLQFGWNVFASVSSPGGGVAYVAHSSGYLFGIAVAAGVLWLKIVPRDVYDLLSLLRAWRRRREYRRTVAGGFDPFSGPGHLRRDAQANRWAEAPVADAAPPEAPGEREAQLRRRIAEAHARHDLPAVTRDYFKLIQIADDAILSQAEQLDVANYLMSAQQYPAAADAYERFLRHYGSYQHIGDIRLMLGLIYGRYLRQYDQAERHLSQASEDLLDPGKIELARDELAVARQHLRR